jgi:glyoxylase-like metal-dependent hydrolase (beta-lactamase superfamily II)
MKAFICVACGCQFTPSEAPPPNCPICEDERQFVPPTGQAWTTLDVIARNHMNSFRQMEPGLIAFATTPQFAIGQRAFLIKTPQGNVLWDCITLLDDATVDIIRGLGGLAGIAISHPHYYSSMVEWSRAFGNVPIHLHAEDKQWITRPDPAIRLWSGDSQEIFDGITLIRCGGHFAGGTVLHWRDGADKRGALLPGDVVMVVADKRYVGFFRSFPNIIPMSAPAVRRVGAMLEPYDFDKIYGAFFDRNVPKGGKEAVMRSVERYAAIVTGDGSAELL